MEDGKIVELFFARSESAISELSTKYGRLCARIAENILGDRSDAEECVNDAWLGVWNTVPPQRPDPLSSYVCRIVRNLALKKSRDKRAQKRDSVFDVALCELEECLPSPRSVEEEIALRETAEVINDFLGKLDRESRIMFVRRYWHADSIGQIAALFGASENSVSVCLFRTRKALKKRLIKEGVLYEKRDGR